MSLFEKTPGGWRVALTVSALTLAVPVTTIAQFGPPQALPPVSQVQEYNSSWEEYQALLRKAGGPTKHTRMSIPDWSGVWERSVRSGQMFSFDESGPGVPDLRGYAKATAVLTPKYQADYDKTLADLRANREWDRLSYCLPAGFPRWLGEPWRRENVTTPEVTWLSHEQINETRRIYTDGRDHIPEADAVPLWLGDSIGFWDKDTLVIHTNHLKAGTYHRGQPAYSFQTSTVEQWRKIDADTIEVRITVYDPPSLVKPWHALFQYRKSKVPNARVDYNSCEENNNVFRTPDGNSGMLLRGDPGYREPATFGIPEVTWDSLPK
jgi:hypothetical protein